LERFAGSGEDLSVAGWDQSMAGAEVMTGYAPTEQIDYASYHWRAEGKRQVGFFARKLIVRLTLIFYHLAQVNLSPRKLASTGFHPVR
jgi:hypothetical protein